MKTVIMEPRPKRPIVIETPLGLITIARHPAGRRRNHLAIELPEGLTAHISRERALDQGRFLVEDDDGRILATYDLLEPVHGPDGQLRDVRALTTPRLASNRPQAFKVIWKDEDNEDETELSQATR